jgi:hypothetical protein
MCLFAAFEVRDERYENMGSYHTCAQGIVARICRVIIVSAYHDGKGKDGFYLLQKGGSAGAG